MIPPPRTVNCPTCRNSFGAGEGLIAVCPRCGERVLVPALEDEPTAPQTLPENIASVPVECKLCSTRFYARPGQVGQVMKCPDCHTDNIVPPPPAKPLKSIMEALSDDEDFKLSDPVETPKYQALSRDALEFERAIRSADGLIKPTSEQHPAEPSRPSTAPPVQPLELQEDLIELVSVEHDEANEIAPTNPVPTAPTRSVEADLIELGPPLEVRPPQTPAPTPVTAAPASSEEIDLFPEDRAPPPVRSTIRSAAAAPPPPPAAIEEDDDDLPLEARLSEVVQRPEHRPVPVMPKPDPSKDDDYGAHVDTEKLKKAARDFLAPGNAPPLPAELARRRPFSSGILNVLAQPAVLGQVVFLSFALAAEIWAGDYILKGIHGTAGEQFFSVMLLIFVIPTSGMCIAVAGALWVAVLEDTANGNEQIRAWPEFFGFEWLSSVWFLLAAAFVSVAPAMIPAWLLLAMGMPADALPLIVYPALFLFFPPVFLSMMEEASVMSPLTKNMMRSFRPLALFWQGFYLRSLGLGLIWVLASITWSVANWFHPMVGNIALLPVSAVMVAIPFLYFRLLGRMAMQYRDYIAAITPDEDDQPSLRHVIE